MSATPETLGPAYRANGVPCSREAFYAIACDPARSVVVEACAGAGKTWMLVSRILRALLAGAQPQQILAITFTRKAAGEMRERLHQWLADFGAADAEQRVRELVLRGMGEAQARAAEPALAALQAHVLASGRGVQVHTFHAWFSQLLRAAPLELLEPLGLQPGMTLLEDLTDLRPELMRRFQAAVLAEPAALADYRALIERHGRNKLDAWFQATLDKRIEVEFADAEGTLEASVPPAAARWPELARWADPLQRLAEDAILRDNLAAAEQALRAKGGVKALESADVLREALASVEPAQALKQAKAGLFTKDGSPRALVVKVPACTAAIDELERLDEQLAQHRAHEDHGRMVRLARVLLGHWRALKRERGLADMNDLEVCAEAVLGDAALAGWVQERLDARLRHLLIDEFQDTSPLQWHALASWLGAYAGAGGGAEALSVFIVGDPKQSIYRFRRAEPKVFEAARRFVAEGLAGTVLECDHTRRNAPAVVAALNAVFGQAAEEAGFTGFRPHTTEVAAARTHAVRALPDQARDRSRAAKNGDGDSAELVWRDSLTEPRVEVQEKLRAVELRHVAAAVAELVQREGVKPGDVMILARKRKLLVQAAQALRAHHLPCAAPDVEALASLPEVRDLVALLDALASPGHDLSLAQALRSPLLGASDDDLLTLALRAREQRGGWWTGLMTAEAQALSPALARAQRLLGGWAQAARVLPPHDLLDRIVHEGELLPRLLAAVPPEQRGLAQQAVRSLLAQALALDGGRYATPYNFVRALRRRALQAEAPQRPEAIQLLTVHGAKGLEAKVVFLLDCDPEVQRDHGPALAVDWPVDRRRPARVAFVANESRWPPSLADLQAAEDEASAREELNALYVALTRARERLVISRTEPHSPVPGTPSWWARLLPQATPWAPEVALPATGEDAAVLPARVAELPVWQPPPAPAALPPAVDDEAARLGQAVHRVLEWQARTDAGALADAARAAVAEFGLPATAAERVAEAAQAVLGAPALDEFFDPARLAWAGNEVPVAAGGEALRIDRLVRVAAGPRQGWWVLDYKLGAAAPELARNREQLARYRDAVAALQPGEPVRAAFIAGRGELHELG